MGHGVHVQELMGVGTRYDLAGKHGARISVMVHKDGHREVYCFEPGAVGDQPSSVVALTEEQARLVGAVLTGTYISS
jgi:TrkA domain protein